MPRLRPTEVRAVTELLSSPAEDEEELARQILETIEELRSKRTDYVLIQWDEGGLAMVFGPFDTKNSALKAIGHTVVGWHKSCKGAVLPLISRTQGGIHVCSDDDPIDVHTGGASTGIQGTT